MGPFRYTYGGMASTFDPELCRKFGEVVSKEYRALSITVALHPQIDGYDGVVCTDWGITADQGPDVDDRGSRCLGVEHLTEAERHLRIIENGVDQFGGNSDIVVNAKKQFPDKPVIVIVHMQNPMVMAELEPYADAILVDFGVTQQAICEVICGKAEPQGLLPVQLPIDMEEVEKHFEDMPLDMRAYVDETGNSYEFGFGLNWNGVIEDERKEQYVHI